MAYGLIVRNRHSLTSDGTTPTVNEIKQYGGWLELSRSALRHNLAGVKRLVGSAQLMAVVKANAYGAGATGMARVLQDEGVTRFAVATVAEGAALREAGVAGDILCLTYFDHSDVHTTLEQDFMTISQESARGEFSAKRLMRGKK